LAASQEIEKLRLLHGEGMINVEQLLAAVADSARYDVFGLVDCALQGDAPRVIKMLDGLRAEGEEPILILWALTRDIRTLVTLSYEARGGNLSESLLAKHRIWDKRKALIRAALQRHTYPRWVQMLHRAGMIDRMVKGQAVGNPWDELVQLIMMMSGVRLPRAVGV
jgi:DNA polymerase-3 subunit delta